jgi:hypothetical protein
MESSSAEIFRAHSHTAPRAIFIHSSVHTASFNPRFLYSTALYCVKPHLDLMFTNSHSEAKPEKLTTMSPATLDHTSATSSFLRDPTTLSKHVAPSFPLTQNNLQEIMEYCATPYGQTSTVSRVARPRGTHLSYVTTHYTVPEATWSSIQTSRTDHVEFNSGLVYMNHSCAPTVELEVYPPDAQGRYPNGVAGEVRVARDRDLQVGDDLTWFYPSTEWASPRPFQCLCGTEGERCIGFQRGSKYLGREQLDRYFINKHVDDLAAERDQK